MIRNRTGNPDHKGWGASRNFIHPSRSYSQGKSHDNGQVHASRNIHKGVDPEPNPENFPVEPEPPRVTKAVVIEGNSLDDIEKSLEEICDG